MLGSSSSGSLLYDRTAIVRHPHGNAGSGVVPEWPHRSRRGAPVVAGASGWRGAPGAGMAADCIGISVVEIVGGTMRPGPSGRIWQLPSSAWVAAVSSINGIFCCMCRIRGDGGLGVASPRHRGGAVRGAARWHARICSRMDRDACDPLRLGRVQKQHRAGPESRQPVMRPYR